MKIEKIYDKWTCNRVEHLINFKYESYKEIIECVVSLTGWDDYNYDYDTILRVWDDNNVEDVINIYIENKDEEE